MMRQRIYRGAVLAVGLMLLAVAAIPLAILLGITVIVWKSMNWLLERNDTK
ncbi:hypothetical protein [uncultured Ruminococcus sp.]|uniref:hypothetical protein n=1 Tax=uncultured Ruminococcus sp. TaxID=165186 RepID=UPI0025FA28E2|nr:hypothetical protein [uncultured Ruminococcus sp.]